MYSPLLSRSDDEPTRYGFDIRRSYDSMATEGLLSSAVLRHRGRVHDTPSPMQSPVTHSVFPESALRYQFVPSLCRLSLLFKIRSVKHASTGEPVESLRVLAVHLQWYPSKTTLWRLMSVVTARLGLDVQCATTVLQLVRKALSHIQYGVSVLPLFNPSPGC